jgi:hypothetical protein
MPTEFKKSYQSPSCHSGLDPESRDFYFFWTPAFAGVTVLSELV